jgi:hypothetical protein
LKSLLQRSAAQSLCLVVQIRPVQIRPVQRSLAGIILVPGGDLWQLVFGTFRPARQTVRDTPLPADFGGGEARQIELDGAVRAGTGARFE